MTDDDDCMVSVVLELPIGLLSAAGDAAKQLQVEIDEFVRAAICASLIKMGQAEIVSIEDDGDDDDMATVTFARAN